MPHYALSIRRDESCMLFTARAIEQGDQREPSECWLGSFLDDAEQ
jgi:hypothetical protein